MTANHARHQTVMAEMIESALLAVALASGIDQGQVARLAQSLQIGILAFKEQRLNGNRDVLRKTDADETAGGNSITVADQTYRVAGGYYFAGVDRSH